MMSSVLGCVPHAQFSSVLLNLTSTPVTHVDRCSCFFLSPLWPPLPSCSLVCSMRKKQKVSREGCTGVVEKNASRLNCRSARRPTPPVLSPEYEF